MTDQEIQDRLDSAIMKAKPENLTDEELNRRLELAEKSTRAASIEEDNTWDVSPRGLLKGSLETLPTIGAIGGGALGTAGGPLGMLGGAGLGAAAGKSLQNIGEKYLLDEDKSRSDIYLDPIKSGLEGATAEGAGQLLSAGARGAADMLRAGAKIKPNAGEITAATRSLGAEPTAGQLSNSRMVQGLESSLEQSPTIGGFLARKEINPARKAIETGTENVFKDVPMIQPSDVGNQFKQQFRGLISNKLEPISKTYDKIRESTEFIDVNPTSLKRVSNNIRNSEKFKSSSGYNIVNQTADDLEKVTSVDDLKSLRSSVGKRMNSPLLDNEAKSALSNMYGKLSSLEQNTIMREAVKQARNSGEGAEIGLNLVGELKGANSAYRGVIQDLGLIGKGSGVSKKVGSIENFLTKIDEIPDEKIVDTFFKTNNRKALTDLQRVNPEGFESLRMAKLDQLRKSSEVNGQVSPARLLKNFRNMEPKTRELVAGPQASKILSDLETVVNSWPAKAGPSGTPQGLEIQNMLNVLNPLQWGKEAARLGQYGLLKSIGGLDSAAGLLKGSSTQNNLRKAPYYLMGNSNE